MILFEIVPMFTDPHGKRSACFANVASTTFTGNIIDALFRLLRISFQPGFYEWSLDRRQKLVTSYTHQELQCHLSACRWNCSKFLRLCIIFYNRTCVVAIGYEPVLRNILTHPINLFPRESFSIFRRITSILLPDYLHPNFMHFFLSNPI
jgi:hypothetical protein